MTFLLFLASLAVLEYLVRGTGQASRPEVKCPDIKAAIDDYSVETETPVADLLALGNALNAQRSLPASNGDQIKEQTAEKVEEQARVGPEGK